MVSFKRYNAFFFIILLLSLLYPFFAFWTSDIEDPEVDDRICEKNYIDCFFIRHFALVAVALLIIVSGAYLIFEYLASLQAERIKKDLVTVTHIKGQRLEEWRQQYLDLAVLSDAALHKSHNGAGIIEKSLQEKNGTRWTGNPVITKNTVPETMPLSQDAAPNFNAFERVEMRFLGSRGLTAVRSSDDVPDDALPPSFIDRVLSRKTLFFGPMSRIRETDGREYEGFCLAVPVMDGGAPERVKSILVYYIDPSSFLYPHLESVMFNGRGERTLLLQRESGGVRVLGGRFDRTVLFKDPDESSHDMRLMRDVGDGQTGFLRGRDVQGEAVVVYVSQISHSEWFVAQQLEEREIHRQVQQLMWRVIIATLLFIAFIAFLLFLWLRHRYIRYQAQHLQLALRQQALIQHYDFLSKYANDIILLIDVDGVIVEGNDRAEEAYGYSRLDLIGKNIRSIFTSSNLEDFEIRWEELKSKKSLLFETENIHLDGAAFPVEISARMIETEGELFVQCIIRDITEKKRSEEMIWRQANFDQVTGLANRRMFMDALHHEVRRGTRSNLRMALLFLDLDKFKDVNDTLGHSIGDMLLQQVGERLKLCVRESDTVARLGGDEFTVILRDVVDFASVKRVAENILAELAEPFVLDDHNVHVSSSIGMTFFPEDATDVETLLKNADQAMYAAKKAGGNRYHYFTQSMQDAVQKRLRLIDDLKDALDRGQFEVLYQPVLSLSSGEIHHAESLVRWRHPARGEIHSAEFIPLLEEAGLIQEFSDWVFLEVARVVKKCRAFIPDFRTGMNISSTQFKNAGLDFQVWFDYLKVLDLPAEGMIVEIKESLLVRMNEHIAQQLLALRDAGMEVALDHFGTGYSSISHLSRLDIDYVKIDSSFTRDVVHGKEEKRLCEAMTAMSHKLGIQVVAEGVEYAEQLDVLKSMGCDYAQGMSIAEPLGSDALEAFLRKQLDMSGASS